MNTLAFENVLRIRSHPCFAEISDSDGMPRGQIKFAHVGRIGKPLAYSDFSFDIAIKTFLSSNCDSCHFAVLSPRLF
jgi:hypothetical protein